MVVEFTYRVEGGPSGGRHSVEQMARALADDWGLNEHTESAARGALREVLSDDIAAEVHACKMTAPTAEVVYTTVKCTSKAQGDGDEEPETWFTNAVWVRPWGAAALGLTMWPEPSAPEHDAYAYRVMTVDEDVDWGSLILAQMILTIHKAFL